jgi:threonine aldolase
VNAGSRPVLDLRSDTITKPTLAMRSAMMAAEVGDAYYDEDPSVNALEERLALDFGMEAAAFMPSGTMSNQVALRVLARAGEAVLCSPDNHVVQYETGALAGINGLQHMPVPLVSAGHVVDIARLPDAIVTPAMRHAPTTAVVAVENTHLRAGGRTYPIAALEELKAACLRLGIPLHVDGARLWHAARVEGIPLARYGAACDTLSVCFSKGLGAPVGSALLGSRERIGSAKKVRKMMGGTMRQCGFLAVAASFALDAHFARLDDDHMGARLLARWLADAWPSASVDVPETNIVLARFLDAASARACLEGALTGAGLRLSALDALTVRGVVHLDVPLEELRARLGA